MYCACVTMPSSTKGKEQLTGIEVEQSRRIANVCIHDQGLFQGGLEGANYFAPPLNLGLVDYFNWLQNEVNIES